MNILLAVDGSSYTKKMLAYLAAHEELLAPTHAYSAVTVQAALPPRARAALGKEAVDRYYADEADKVFKPVNKFLERQRRGGTDRPTPSSTPCLCGVFLRPRVTVQLLNN